MTAVAWSRPDPAATDEHARPPGGPERRRWHDARVAAGVCALVAVLAQLPVLRTRTFYFWDDSAAQFVPMWHELGRRLLHGEFPLLLDTDGWMGGNVAAEALFGVWNPVNLANYVLVAGLPDLAVAAECVKSEYLVLYALGAYLLFREYGAARWASSAVAVALPFAGFTLFFDASGWAAGLMATAWVPWVWWACRRMARGAHGAIWAFAAGYLAITAGNPYGLLAVCLVLLGLAVEFGLHRRWRAVRHLVLVGLALGGVALLVFAPLVANSTVGTRQNKELYNSGTLVPSLNDLLAASMPSYVPHIHSFAPAVERLTVPAVFFAWFVVPLLPWLRWAELRARRRVLTGALVVAGIYLVATIGPSNVWMFRWPLRLLQYGFLGLGVVYAVLLSAGLRTDRAGRRALVTAGVLLASAYLAFAAWPHISVEHVLALLVLAGLTTAAVGAARRGSQWVVAVLHLGTAVVLVLQLLWFPVNRDFAEYDFPTSVRALHARFADRYQGTTFQVANLSAIAGDGRRAWNDVLFGNMYRAAGVTSTVSYTGTGNRYFADALCLTYVSGTCPQAYQRLWQPTTLGGAPLADLMRIRTVVVQRALLADPSIPGGWQVIDRDDQVTVLRRTAADAFPAGRLSWASPDVTVTGDVAVGQGAETVRFHHNGQGRAAQLAFARLAWPGYRADVGGRAAATHIGPAGLLVVDLPDGVQDGELRLRWTPPGFTLSLGAAALGLFGTLMLTFVQRRQRRGSSGR